MNYGVYRYDKKEFVIYFSIGYSIAAVILFLFYHRVFLALVLGFLGGYIFLKCYKKVLVEKRRWQLTMEFKDAMDALSAALAARILHGSCHVGSQKGLAFVIWQGNPYDAGIKGYMYETYLIQVFR